MHPHIGVDFHVVCYFYHIFFYSRLHSHTVKFLFQDDFTIQNISQNAGIFFSFFTERNLAMDIFVFLFLLSVFQLQKKLE